MGHEEKFSADEPTNTEGSGNASQMGHENQTLGDTPKTPKDLPEIPGGNGNSKALMGHEEKSEVGPEKELENKGTVIAKSNNATQKAASQKEAFRVAAKLLTEGVIQEGDLEQKVAQLAKYEPEQIRDYEKAVFAKVKANKRGLTASSEGLEKPLIINEASSRKKTADKNLVSKIQELLSLNQKNKLVEEMPDFKVRNLYR
jgi:hypothetical protein